MAVDQLLATQYIFIDLRRFSPKGISMDEWIKRTLLICLLSIPGTTKETIAYWSSQRVLGWSISGIVKSFMGNNRFFIHFDEVDYIKEVHPSLAHANFSEEVVKRYYEFWTTVQPIMHAGNFVYFSGRSTILYALSRGWFHSIGLISK